MKIVTRGNIFQDMKKQWRIKDIIDLEYFFTAMKSAEMKQLKKLCRREIGISI